MGSVLTRTVGYLTGSGQEHHIWKKEADPYSEFVCDVVDAVVQGNCQLLDDLHEEGLCMQWGGIDMVVASPPLLHQSIIHGHTHVMKYLIEHGASLEETNSCGMTALHEACKRRKLGCIELLIDKTYNIDRRDVWGRTPLIKALVYRNVEAAELLLEKGANPNAIDVYGTTPLNTAIDYGMEDVLRILVRHGADVNLMSRNTVRSSGPPLYLAINNQNPSMVRELLALGASTQPCPHHYSGSWGGPWQYLSFVNSTPGSLPVLHHPNAVVMALAEVMKRGLSDMTASSMEVLMILLSAHGHPLGPLPDVMIRMLVNSHSHSTNFLLLHKLHICSSSCEDDILFASRSQHRAQHNNNNTNNNNNNNNNNISSSVDEQRAPRIVTSLQNQARRIVRKAVMGSGRNVMWATERLQCPPALKSLTLLKDIDRAFDMQGKKPFLSRTL